MIDRQRKKRVWDSIKERLGGRLAIDPKNNKPDIVLLRCQKMPPGYRWF